VFWLSAAVQSWREPLWNSRDEAAHYDFVDRLTDGERPRPRDWISAHTLELSTRHFSGPGEQAHGRSARALGVAGRSYEAHQPPLYYALLSVPNRLLRGHVAPALQIRLLRLGSLGLAALGAAAVLVAGYRFSSALPGLETASTLAALGLSIGPVSTHTTLGNDALGSAFGGLALFATIALVVGRRTWASGFLIAAIAAAVLTKLTSAPLLLLVALVLGQEGRVTRTWVAVGCLLGVLTLALGPGSQSWGVPWRSAALERDFAHWVAPVASPRRFLDHWFADAVGQAGRPGAGAAVAAVICLGAVLVVLRRRELGRPTRLLAFWSVGLTLAAAAGALALDSQVPGVHWHAFRHSSAVAPFLYLGLAGSVALLLTPSPRTNCDPSRYRRPGAHRDSRRPPSRL
jgi:hypothetical protein